MRYQKNGYKFTYNKSLKWDCHNRRCFQHNAGCVRFALRAPLSPLARRYAPVKLMRNFLGFIILLLLVSCTTVDVNKEYTEASENLDKDPVKAYKLLNHAAEQGHTEAMALLGAELLMACNGGGFNNPKSDRCWKISKDNKKAMNYLLKAAENGSSYANEWLVTIYTSGFPGLEELKNETNAFYWANRNTDNARGLCTVAQMHEAGIGTEKNIQKAEKYYNESIKIGKGEEAEFWVEKSAEAIAKMYASGGNGLNKDCEKSSRYLTKVVIECTSYYISWYEREITSLRSSGNCVNEYQSLESLCPNT